jgi:hypothetical protein
MSLFLIIYGGLSMIFTTGLLIYHSKLISNNMTTKEELKKFFVNPFGDPYSRNCQRNCQNILFPRLSSKNILDILVWGDIDDSSISEDKNHLMDNDKYKLNNSKESNSIKDNQSIHSQKYSDVNENITSKDNKRVIPEFSFNLSIDNNNGNPL